MVAYANSNIILTKKVAVLPANDNDMTQPTFNMFTDYVKRIYLLELEINDSKDTIRDVSYLD